MDPADMRANAEAGGRFGHSDVIADLLRRVRRRWFGSKLADALAKAAAVAAAIVGAGVLIDRLSPLSGLPLLLLAGVTGVAAVGVLAAGLSVVRRRPTDLQIARFVEERCPELEDSLASAAEYASRPRQSAYQDLLLADASARARAIDLDRLIDRARLRRSAGFAALSTVGLALALGLAADPAQRALQVFWMYAFPERVAIEVLPGDARVAAGTPVRVTARLSGSARVADAAQPVLRYRHAGSDEVALPMRVEDGRFVAELPAADADLGYRVTAGNASSPDYLIEALYAPRVERIDVLYEYPDFTGLAPRKEEDGGDIYAPAGTRVRLRIFADKPIASGEMVLGSDSSVALDAGSEDRTVLEASYEVVEDGSYRVQLADADGLRSTGDTEYFIRIMNDRPPDVRVLRPGGDRQVTSLEEVAIEARADDDYGLERFDLVYAVRGGPEKAVSLGRDAGARTLTGSHTLFLEDLDVQPGDFVTYYVRARDVSRAKRSTESRSDIFFLEVKPFDEEFVAAQSQAMAGAGGAVEDLAAAQKEIIIATWKLDRRATGGKSKEDIGTVAAAQAELKAKAADAAGSMGAPSRRRRSTPRQDAPSEPMRAAVEAMGRAQASLEELDTSKALPHEMEALNQLLRAQAEIRRRQVAQQASAGGSGSGRAGQDLSALFDRELQRQQETNYETRENPAQQGEDPESEALARVRELARRQDALARQQRELAEQQAGLTPEELKRQLERLTREQTELRRQAEELSRELARQQRGAASQQADARGRQDGADEQRMREISEEMQSAASELRRESPGDASARSDRALEKLRNLEQQLAGGQPDERRRALGELQLESQQVADAQRRIGSEVSRMQGAEKPNGDALRRLAGEQERLAERTRELQRGVGELARNSASDARDALSEAAAAMEQERLADRMREVADELRSAEAAGRAGESGAAPAPAGAKEPTGTAQPSMGEIAAQNESLARSLDQLSAQLQSADAGQDPERRQLSEELARARQLRERLDEIEQRLDQLARSEPPGDAPGAQPNGSPQPSGQSPSDAQSPSAAEAPGGSQEARSGQEGQQGEAGREGRGSGGRAGELASLREQYERQLRETGELLEQLQQANPALGRSLSTPEGHQYSLSAPGTEAFKQDFAEWETLRRDVELALERFEASRSQKLYEKETEDRLHAGADSRLPEAYRKLVARYYQSLAARTKE